jgi:hypothetical protein
MFHGPAMNMGIANAVPGDGFTVADGARQRGNDRIAAYCGWYGDQNDGTANVTAVHPDVSFLFQNFKMKHFMKHR